MPAMTQPTQDLERAQAWFQRHAPALRSLLLGVLRDEAAARYTAAATEYNRKRTLSSSYKKP